MLDISTLTPSKDLHNVYELEDAVLAEQLSLLQDKQDEGADILILINKCDV